MYDALYIQCASSHCTKAGVVNLIIRLYSSIIRKRSTIAQLKEQAANAEKENKYTLSSIKYIKF